MMKKLYCLIFILLFCSSTIFADGPKRPYAPTIDSSGAITNPATKDKQDIIITELQTLIAADTTNSSTTPLLGTASSPADTFTGTATILTSWASGTISVFADQDSITDGFKVQYSSDGTNWDHEHSYSVMANVSKTIPVDREGLYFRVVYTNGATGQGTFRLQTLLSKNTSNPHTHPIEFTFDGTHPAALTRTVMAVKKPNNDYTNVQGTSSGNFKVSLEESNGDVKIDGLNVREKSRTAFGEVLVGQLYPQYQGSFEYTVSNTDLNTNTITNGGTVTQANAMAVMGTSTTTNSTALFQSKQHAKYRPGLGGVGRFTSLFASPIAGTEQYIGLMDATGSSQAFLNGYGIGYNGTTFGFHRWSNDTLTTITQANWDDPLDGSGDSGMTIDHTKINVWEIRFQYLGAGKILLCVEDDSTGNFVVAHTILYANNFVEPSVYNPNFHHTMWVDNGGTTDNMIMKSASYGYFIEGKTSFIELHQPINGTGIKEKTTVTSEVAIFTIRNKSTYASKTNFIDIVLNNIGASIEASSANNLGTIRIVKNATLGGTPSYADINTTDSVIEIDVAGTTVTGGKDLGSVQLAGKNDKDRVPLLDNKIILNPGETLTIAGSSANSATIDANATWKELF